jgi:uncharacterized membrane protein YgcG
VKRLALLLPLVLLLLLPKPVAADEGWVIVQFDANYQIRQDGSVDVIEDIRVDFGTQRHHGIFRVIPLTFKYDADYLQRVRIEDTAVTDGTRPLQFGESHDGDKLTLQIGDPDVEVSGPQRYVISYRLLGILNSREDPGSEPSEWDEFYWNVTGNEWPVRILAANASVQVPAIIDVICYQGPVGSSDRCDAGERNTEAQFRLTDPQPEGGGMTIAIKIPTGAVSYPPPELLKVKSVGEQISDFVGLKPLPILAAILVGVVSIAGVLRYWWLAGRDRWLGDLQYLTGEKRERRRPLFAKDTVVIEYQPPETARYGRRLRPAEIGTLLDEQADTLDVSATIVDLAVRGYLRITEIEKKQWLFGSTDYKLERLKPSDGELLPYERKLLDGLFEDGETVNMSDLKNEFYTTLSTVKSDLYDQVVKQDAYFAKNPETVRTVNYVAGFVLAGVGVGAIVLLGTALGAAIVGIPIVFAGLLMLALAHAMPRRTGPGREMYRRILGFRQYMTVAETDRQRFNEETNLFQEYLPYAIVYGCVDKWAEAFEGLENQPDTSSWYVSTHAFAPLAFSSSLQSFSSSMSSAIASTPGGSGGSGFSGGFSGGGGGGGGGGSW